jgi:hypothetical protein
MKKTVTLVAALIILSILNSCEFVQQQQPNIIILEIVDSYKPQEFLESGTLEIYKSGVNPLGSPMEKIRSLSINDIHSSPRDKELFLNIGRYYFKATGFSVYKKAITGHGEISKEFSYNYEGGKQKLKIVLE